VRVKSKVEYILYRALKDKQAAGYLRVTYEAELELPIAGRPVRFKPDFTIEVGDASYYWEHLGELDRREYSNDWAVRRAGYEAKGLGDVLITTDDLNGIKEDRAQTVIAEILAGRLTATADRPYSRHHYALYSV